jgi:hypothetical protein
MMTKEQAIRRIGIVTSLVAVSTVLASGTECPELLAFRLSGINYFRICATWAVVYS